VRARSLAATVIAILLVALSAVTLDGCGRKGRLTPPPGSTYPRHYPPE